jgi:hypothetical protein
MGTRITANKGKFLLQGILQQQTMISLKQKTHAGSLKSPSCFALFPLLPSVQFQQKATKETKKEAAKNSPQQWEISCFPMGKAVGVIQPSCPAMSHFSHNRGC